MSTSSFVSFRALSGVQLHYARMPLAAYGSRGVSYKFRGRPELFSALKAALDELGTVCPLGRPEIMTSAGVYVDKPGQHRLGRAVDVDAIFWNDFDFITLEYHSYPAFYLAVESIFRRHFGLGLNFLYDKPHQDHFHLDLSAPVDYNTGSRSATLFLQAALAHVHGEPVEIDGRWGPQTKGASDRVRKSLGLNGQLTSVQTWKSFLKKTAELGFAKSGIEGHAAKLQPDLSTKAENLMNIVDGIELENTEGRQLRDSVRSLLESPEIARHTGSDQPYEAFRTQVVKEIVNFEARRDSKGKIKVYILPGDDGGGKYEVAGINEKYHPEMASELRDIIEKDKNPDLAEEIAIEYIAAYTDTVARWCSTRAVEAYLRDSAWNRGPRGAALILQRALGFKGPKLDGKIGPISKTAVAIAEQDPEDLLKAMRSAREEYERSRGRDESSKFWKGLVNRWNKALKLAEIYL